MKKGLEYNKGSLTVYSKFASFKAENPWLAQLTGIKSRKGKELIKFRILIFICFLSSNREAKGLLYNSLCNWLPGHKLKWKIMPSIIAIQKPKLEIHPKSMLAGLSIPFIVLSLLVLVPMLWMLILNIGRSCLSDFLVSWKPQWFVGLFLMNYYLVFLMSSSSTLGYKIRQ